MLNMCLPLLHFRKGKLNQVKSNIRVCGEVKLLFIPSGRVCGNTLPRANTAPAEFPHTIIRLETGSAREHVLHASVCIVKPVVVNTNCRTATQETRTECVKCERAGRMAKFSDKIP